MLMLLSPAKTQDFHTPIAVPKETKPKLWKHGQILVDGLKEKSAKDIEKLMGVSEKIATLNFDRFQEFGPRFTQQNSKACVMAFKGDVYRGLDATSLEKKDLVYAQDHLRILSGLYGLLKPLDLIQPYRLEMKTKMLNPRGKDLYAFWGDLITNTIDKELKASGEGVVLNLASNEYFNALQPESLAASVISPAFKEYKNGQFKILSMFAKVARGSMARWVIQNKVTEPKDLKKFKVDGYRFNKELSTENKPVFTRGG